jgi:hypothetical protein
MSMPAVEPKLEALLLRIVPELAAGWEGASASEVSQLEAIAGRPLPDFYRWFLSRMGKNMGPMRYPTVDFSARSILEAYAEHSIERHQRFLLIGYERDELMPLHYFYDLDRPARGDALVVRMLTPRDETHEQFETFREMLAWGELWTQRVERAHQRCGGSLRAPSGGPYDSLDPVMRRLGFTAPIETGAFCGLYERSDATLICSGTPSDAPNLGTFALGGLNASSLGQVLSAISSESPLAITLSAWTPPLPGDG